MIRIEYQTIKNFRINQLKFHRQSKSKKLGHYLVGKILGEGGFAHVYKAEETYTKQRVAAKFIKIPLDSQDLMERIDEQVQILRVIDHPNIVRIYQTFQDQKNYAIITELIKGQDLFKYIWNHGPIKQNVAAHIFHQIVLTVKYLHEKGIVHRDIKAENIMIDQNFNAKLIDFGLATDIKKHNNQLLSTICGSPSYLSPQLVQKKPYDGKKVDIWCLGVVLYVLLQANLPFDSITQYQKNQNIKKMKWHTTSTSSAEARELYELIFKSCDQRASIDDLLNSEFFKKHHLKVQKNNPKKNFKKETQVFNQIQELLSVSPQTIKIQIEQKKLGAIYSIYSILMSKNKIYGRQFVKRKSKTLQLRSNAKGSTQLRQDQKQSNYREKSSIRFHKVQKTIYSTPKPKKNIRDQRSPLTKNIIKTSFKNNGMQKEMFFRDKLPTQQKGNCKIFQLFKGQKIIGNKINFSKVVKILESKPQLREQSPESPKRILDCIKRYR